MKHTILFINNNNKVVTVGVKHGYDNIVTVFNDVYVAINAGQVLLCDKNNEDASDYFVSELKDTTIIHRED